MKIKSISVQLWLLLLLSTVFVKIYQHNLYIKTMYRYQRLGREQDRLEKERNELLAASFDQRQPLLVMRACEQRGMVPLALEAIVTPSQTAQVEFVGTPSTTQALVAFGLLPDPVKAFTQGANDACPRL